MTVMRKKIAEHMVLSAHTSPHVYSVYEVELRAVHALRESRKAAFEAAGAKLTFTAFIAKVTVDALRQFPMVNASIDGDNIVYRKDINLGIAVALDNGLIVPVIRNADEKNLLGLSRAINDLSGRARSKRLSPEEVQAGTFTITNPGVFGALYGLPLINQPQVAILGVGSIDKRVVVIDDAIAIRPVCHLTLGYDHRLDRWRGSGSVSHLDEGAPGALRGGVALTEGAARQIEVRQLGVVPYAEGLALQKTLVEERKANRIPDQLLLLEHPPVITLGVKTRADRSHVVASESTLRDARHRGGRDRARRRRDVSRPGPAGRLSDPRSQARSLRRSSLRSRPRRGADPGGRAVRHHAPAACPG